MGQQTVLSHVSILNENTRSFLKVFEGVSKMPRTVHSALGGDLCRGCALEFAVDGGDDFWKCLGPESEFEDAEPIDFVLDVVRRVEGWKARLTLNIDAEAARAIASRQGVGKIRHLEVRFLWLLDVVRSGIVCLSKVWGNTNPADALTKPMSLRETSELLERVGYSEVA